MSEVTYHVALRRRGAYWNWVLWERVTAPYRETVIVDEGLTLRRSAAIRKGEQAKADWQHRDTAECAMLDS